MKIMMRQVTTIFTSIGNQIFKTIRDSCVDWKVKVVATWHFEQNIIYEIKINSRYTGNGHHSGGPAFDDDDPLEVADLSKSFFQLDVGSDSEASSLPRSLGGVSGPGQSNLSTEVAALIQSEMAASHLRNHRRMLQQNGHNNALNNGRTESPDMDFLEMDFDPGDDSESEENKDESEPPPPISNGHLGNYVCQV